MVYDSWKKVITLVAKIAKELREKDPKLTVPESTKLAWKDKRVLDARKEFNEHKEKKKGKAEGGAARKTRKRPKTKAKAKTTRARK